MNVSLVLSYIHLRMNNLVKRAENLGPPQNASQLRALELSEGKQGQFHNAWVAAYWLACSSQSTRQYYLSFLLGTYSK